MDAGIAMTSVGRFGKVLVILPTHYQIGNDKLCALNWRVMYCFSPEFKLGRYWAFTSIRKTPSFGSSGIIIETKPFKHFPAVEVRYGPAFNIGPAGTTETRVRLLIRF